MIRAERTKGCEKIKWFQILMLIVLLVFFWAMYLIYGPGVYNDSDQYIKMHIHREPVYPFFLFLLRSAFGEGYLTPMALLQGSLAAYAIWNLTVAVAAQFQMKKWEQIVTMMVMLMPHLMTKFMSSLHLFLTNSVMSEAICLPLFTLFITKCWQMAWNRQKKDILLAAVYALVLSLTRGQMMVCILMWMVILGITYFCTQREKLVRLLAGVLAVTMLLFVARGLITRTYNLVFNGRFINNTYASVNTLTNILYASDREDGEGIADEEARRFFYEMYDMADEALANYKYAPATIVGKVEHIEEWHDTIKYNYIEDVFYQYYDHHVTSDYITQNLMADEVASKIMKGVLPRCIGQWIADYFLISMYGLIRCIGIVHPLINVIVLLIYVGSMILTVKLLLEYKKNKSQNSAVILSSVTFLIALLAVFANVYALSITIMCLSRYLVYVFGPFYVGIYVMLRTAFVENSE